MTTIEPQKQQDETATAPEVLNLCNELTRDFAHAPVLMPIVVLQGDESPDISPQLPPPPRQPESGHDPAAGLVDRLHDTYKGRVRCRRFANKRGYAPPVPGSPLPGVPGMLAEYDRALTLVRALATPKGWDTAEGWPYRSYSFPRSALLAAIEEAVAESVPANASAPANGNAPAGNNSSPGENAPAAQRPDQWAAFKRLTSLRRRRPVSGSLAALRSVLAVLMPVAAVVLSVELATLSTPRRAPLVLLLTVLIILASWLVLLCRQSFTAPLSGLFPASHWFATSTFILADDQPVDEPPARLPRLVLLLPRWSRRIRAVREERARMIVGQLAVAYYGSPSADEWAPGDATASGAERERAMQLYLSFRVHALLEDLRANYRPWTFDLRRRKRRWPPMLFLPGVDQLPGGVRFVQAVSDLRSRRSETDPLLVVASSWRRLIPHAANPAPEPDDGSTSLYQRWIRRLRVEQSPSLGDRLPWVLLLKVKADSARLPKDGRARPRAGWSVWHLWSRWTVACVLVLLCLGGFQRSQWIGRQYCGGWLFGHDAKLLVVNGECIGTDTTGRTAFLQAKQGVTLTGAMTASGAMPAADSPVSLAKVNLADLESLIDSQNQEATAPYVTFVYAGGLTAPTGSTDPLDALKELAGMLAWQYYVNTTQDDHVKIRIDIANDGDNSGQEQRMAQTIVDASNQDPSITGVIGLGVDTSQTPAAIQDFADADLPLLDTTDSDNRYPQDDWDYFGLSATNAEEAHALVGRYARNGNGRLAAVFERLGPDGQPTDPYTRQQAQSAEAALRGAGFKLVEANGRPGPIGYTTRTAMANTPGIEHAICADHPPVIYFAGRHQDMQQLVGLLGKERKCFSGAVTVLSGDDMAVTEFPGTRAKALAPDMKLYYVAQADPAYVPSTPGDGADNGSGLNSDLESALNLGDTPSYASPVFANGLLALGFDAADLLYSQSAAGGAGASEQEQALPRSAVGPGLRCPQESVGDGATGPLGFADVRHGLDFFKAVTVTGSPNPQQVTFQAHQQTVPGTCAPNVAPSGS